MFAWSISSDAEMYGGCGAWFSGRAFACIWKALGLNTSTEKKKVQYIYQTRDVHFKMCTINFIELRALREKIFTSWNCLTFNIVVICKGLIPGPPLHTQIGECLSPLFKKGVTFACSVFTLFWYWGIETRGALLLQPFQNFETGSCLEPC